MGFEIAQIIPENFLEEWKPVSKPALIGWLVFYALFLVYAFTDKEGFLFIDNANLIVHESGHLFFGWFGPTLGLWGGTLMELLVPLLLAIYFAFNRQATGTAFCIFFLFENLLYISVYMADARTQDLPLVTVGDPENGGHDWFNIFSQLGLLERDTAIASVVKAIGWMGMLATVAWLIWRFYAGQRANTVE